MAVTATNLHGKFVSDPIREFFYDSTGEAMSTIVAANYFTVASLTGNALKSGDRVFIKASDGDGWFKVSSNGTTAALIPVGWVNTFTTQASTGALNAFGTNYISATGNVNFTLEVPSEAGQMVRIVQGSASTSITITTTGSISGDTDTVMTLNALDDTALLLAVSLTKWVQVSVAGGTAGTTNTSSVFHATS